MNQVETFNWANSGDDANVIGNKIHVKVRRFKIIKKKLKIWLSGFWAVSRVGILKLSCRSWNRSIYSSHFIVHYGSLRETGDEIHPLWVCYSCRHQVGQKPLFGQMHVIGLVRLVVDKRQSSRRIRLHRRCHRHSKIII